MRIAMVSELVGDTRGFGQERVVREETRMLREAGHEVFHLVSSVLDDVTTDGLMATPEFFRNDLRTPRGRLSLRRDEVRRWLAGLRPDIVHLHDAPDPGFLPELIASYPTVHSVHMYSATCPASTRRLVEPRGLDPWCRFRSGWSCLAHDRKHRCLSSFKSPLHRAHVVLEYLRKRRALRRAPVALAVSRGIAEALVADGWPVHAVRVLYNPVPLLPRLEPEEGAPRRLVVSAARLVPIKGLDVLLRAMVLVTERVPATLWICGDGAERARLEALSAELGLGRNVKFLGATDHERTQRLFASAALYVQPNTGPEAFGLSAAEASGLGIPVVASDVGALGEIVVDGQTGRLVPPGDPAGLAAAMIDALDDKAKAREWGRAGRERVSKLFSPAEHLAGLVAAYAAAGAVTTPTLVRRPLPVKAKARRRAAGRS